MQRVEDLHDRRGEIREASGSQNGAARVFTLTVPSSARGAPRDVSGNGHTPRQPTKTREELKTRELLWIRCPHSVAASGLGRLLEKEFKVHLGEDPPEEGTPCSVVLYADAADGLRQGIKSALARYPDVPVVVFGPRADLPLAEIALKGGARGFVHAEMTPEQLIRALIVASEGEIVAPRKLLEYLVNDEGATPDLDALSPRQREILSFVADGLSNAEIAKNLFLSESTIKQHLRGTYKALGVRNRAQAARIFRQDARR